MYSKPGLCVLLKWMIYRSGSVVTDIIQQGREDMLAAA